MRRPWLTDEIGMLRELYTSHTAAEIATRLGRPIKTVQTKAHKLGLRKSLEWIAERSRQVARQPPHGGARWQFKPGHATWNKGLPGSTGLHANTREHWFAEGHMPHTWRPIGSHRITKDGVLQRKVSDTHYTPRDWRAVHALVWEAAHGPVPAGRVVVFKPGRKTTDADAITVDALECVSRSELMARNTVHRYPKAIAQLVQLRGALNRQINRKAKEAETAA